MYKARFEIRAFDFVQAHWMNNRTLNLVLLVSGVYFDAISIVYIFVTCLCFCCFGVFNPLGFKLKLKKYWELIFKPLFKLVLLDV